MVHRDWFWVFYAVISKPNYFLKFSLEFLQFLKIIFCLCMPSTCAMLLCQFSTVVKSLFLLHTSCSCPRISLVLSIITSTCEFMFSLNLFQPYHFPEFRLPVLLVWAIFVVPRCATCPVAGFRALLPSADLNLQAFFV